MNALTLVHNAIKAYVGEGGVCIDATAGRGLFVRLLRAYFPLCKV